jgi:hypothetical protein
MRSFEGFFRQAVEKCFPGSTVKVSYWGPKDGAHAWRVEVGGLMRDLSQMQAELAVGGRYEDFRNLFGY